MYHHTQNFIIRHPHFPISVIREVLQDDMRLHQTISSNDFKEAFFLASPVLYDILLKYLDNRLNKKEQDKAKISILKYISRMSTRCTPFATLATCALGIFSDETNIVLNNSLNKHFRLDMQFLYNLSQEIQSDYKLRIHFKYSINSTIYKTTNTIRFISYEYVKSKRMYKIEEIKRTTIINDLMKICKKPLFFSEIMTHILNNYHIAHDVATQYLNDLIDNQILISELNPFATGPDYFNFLISRISQIAIKNKYSKPLISIQRKLRELNDNSNQNCIKLCKEIEAIVHDLNIPYDKKYLFQVDTTRNLEHNKISNRISSQILDYIKFITSIKPIHEHSNLSEFKTKFLNRYELQEISLLEALDPDIGIGFITTNSKLPNPLIKDINIPRTNKEQHKQQYNNYLVNLIFNDKLHIHKEITLDNNSNNLINWQKQKKFPISFSAKFNLFINECTEEYLISDITFNCNSAGNLIARFAYCNDNINSLLHEIVSAEKNHENDYILAEISHIPESRIGNVINRPIIRDFEIAYISGSVRNDNEVINPNDILISVKNDTIYLRSKKTGKYLIPKLTNAHNFQNNPSSVYLFLCEIQSQYTNIDFNFSWGTLENKLNYFPRIRYKDIIISLAKWRFTKNDFSTIIQEYNITEIINWKNRYNIPDTITIVEGDNKLFIDFQIEQSCKIFFYEVRKKNSLIIEEFINDHSISKGENGQIYMNEIIIPFIQ